MTPVEPAIVKESKPQVRKQIYDTLLTVLMGSSVVQPTPIVRYLLTMMRMTMMCIRVNIG